MSNLFGTDGIRGKANDFPLNPENIVKIGLAFSQYWRENTGSSSCLIGNDGRRSADMISSALSAGLMSGGLDVQNIGFCSTPSLSFLTKHNDSCGGIMISASHNPYEDNGLKPFQSSGEKFYEEQETEIEKILNLETSEIHSDGEMGYSYSRESWISDYIQNLQSNNFVFPGHVVIDCANGGTSKLAPAILQNYCKELTVINNEPTGTNINENSGSLHPEGLIQTVQSKNADIGFAFDGDGDRVIAVDENGKKQNGDVIMFLLADAFSRQNKLPGNGIVITTMSNFGLRLALENRDINYEVVGVGDKIVFRTMKENNWRLGGEQSGHVIDRNWLPTGDGLHVLLSILEACVNTATPLSEWGEQLDIFPQTLHNLDVDEKPALETLDQTQEVIQDVDEELGNKGRVFVRYSGTESVARIMVEGRNKSKLDEYAEQIAEIMDEEIHGGAS